MISAIWLRYLGLATAVLLFLACCFADAGAQKRRRRSRPATASASPSPARGDQNTDPRIVSTADQSTSDPNGRNGSSRTVKPAPTPDPQTDALRRDVSDLTKKLSALTDKMGALEEHERVLMDLERLNQAEQRAETFRVQLRDVQTKEMDVQSQIDQIEYALLPENLERAIGTYGTTHPEDLRQARRKQLEAQRDKLHDQLDLLEKSRLRLEAAISSSDTEIELLRKRVDLIKLQNPDAADAETAAPTPTPTPTPEPGEQPR